MTINYIAVIKKKKTITFEHVKMSDVDTEQGVRHQSLVRQLL